MVKNIRERALQRPSFQFIEVDEVRCFHAGFFADFDESGGLEEGFGVSVGGPGGEVDDLVRVGFVFEDLIGSFAGFLADACGVIEDFFPGGIVGDFVNDENVGHE